MIDPEVLVEVPMFQTLPQSERKRLAGMMREENLPAGRILFEVGDPGSSMYIIRSGKIRISIPGDSGEEVALATLAAGDFFGELALLDQNPRSARATAVDLAQLYSLEREQFLSFVGSRPDAALSMLSATAKRLRHTDELMRSRASFDVNEEFKRHETRGGRWADGMANVMGSWTFMLALMGFTALWSVLVLAFQLDMLDSEDMPKLALILGIVQTLSGPIIMMSQNRDQIRDRIRADADFKVNLKNEVAIEKALERLDEVRRALPELKRQVKEHETVVKKQSEALRKALIRSGALADPSAPPRAPVGTGSQSGAGVVGAGTGARLTPLPGPLPEEEVIGEGTAIFMPGEHRSGDSGKTAAIGAETSKSGRHPVVGSASATADLGVLPPGMMAGTGSQTAPAGAASYPPGPGAYGAPAGAYAAVPPAPEQGVPGSYVVPQQGAPQAQGGGYVAAEAPTPVPGRPSPPPGPLPGVYTQEGTEPLGSGTSTMNTLFVRDLRAATGPVTIGTPRRGDTHDGDTPDPDPDDDADLDEDDDAHGEATARDAVASGPVPAGTASTKGGASSAGRASGADTLKGSLADALKAFRPQG